MVAQAALETGWGRAELRRADGTPSHNLFNIKAGSDWKGAVVEVPVKEYANGRAYTENARFRAYGSYEEAFRDYANLLRNSPRYAEVLGQQDGAGFARSLQQAGYATDPMYADKLARIISGSTLRSALAG
jgi:flagellar protein FlgJ